MNLEIDFTAKALYLRLAHGRVEDTLELADGVVADVDESGTVLGIEFLHIERFAPFVAAHPDLVALPAQLTYTSVDRDKTWQVEIGGFSHGANGDHLSRVIELNGTFLMEIIADPTLVDRIPDGETVILRPAVARN